jgi:hypothetical protein
MVLSQEPNAKLRFKYNNNAEKIEEQLIKECRERKGVVPARIGRIFDKGFDPSADEVYWTHSLKCVPSSNQDINREWNACALICKGHLKREIELIPSESLVLIALGNYALALCRHVLEGTPLSNPRGITKYMQERASPDSQEIRFLEKRVLLFPFIHPSHGAQVLEEHRCLAEIEKSFVEKIRLT